MPTVPEYQVGQVDTRPLGAPQLTLNPSGAFGEQVGAAVEKAGDAVADQGIKQVEDARKQADDAFSNQLADQFGKWDEANIQRGAKTKKGTNYSPADTDQYLNDFEKFSQQLGQTARTDSQRRILERTWRERREVTRHELLAHEKQQGEIVAKENFENGLTTDVQTAINNSWSPTLVQQSVDSAIKRIDANAAAFGVPADEVKVQKLATTTRIHAGVIAKLKDGDDNTSPNAIKALEYFKAHSKEIDPEKADSIYKNVHAAAIQASSRVAASDIQNQVGARNFTEQYAEAKRRLEAGKLNAETYKQVLEDIKIDEGVDEHARSKAQDDLLGKVVNNIEKAAEAKLPVILSDNDPDLANLDQPHQARAREHARQLLNQRRALSNAADAELRRMDREAMAEFTHLPLKDKATLDIDQRYVGATSEPARKVMRAIQASSKILLERGDEVHDNEFTQQMRSIANEIPNATDDVKKDFFSKMVLRRALWMKNNENRNPHQKDIDEMVADEVRLGDFAKKSVWKPHWLSGNKYKFQVSPDDLKDWSPFDPQDQPWIPGVNPTSPGASVPTSTKGPAPQGKLKAGYIGVKKKGSNNVLQMKAEFEDQLGKPGPYKDWEKVQ